MSDFPEGRIESCNAAPIRADGAFVLYWMLAARRCEWNFALDRAVELATRLRKPLLILEALRCDYPWASDRIHRFVLDGMADNTRRLKATAAAYYPFVERSAGEGKGLVAALAEVACAVVTDDVPCFLFPRAVAAAASRARSRVEKVDSWGLLPFREAPAAFPTAYAFRRFLQKALPQRLLEHPSPDPLSGAKLPRMGALKAEILERWPVASEALLRGEPHALRRLPIDHDVPEASIRGGPVAAASALKVFLDRRLRRYLELRGHPDHEMTSGLSPYLHFGHISVHAVFAELALRETWSVRDLASRSMGRRTGWWGMSSEAEAFLDQLITWRELSMNFCATRDDYDRYESLPSWALRTLGEHAADPRPIRYERAALEGAATHDELWNAAQTQLFREGVLHNYLRMLWGKKILEWSAAPDEALDTMIELNNRYALDGRDPNSYSGIFWVLGRYDRPWGPERPIFGTVRYMSSENTRRKLQVTEYLRRFRPQEPVG